jgi:hypothetical protein
MLIPIFVLVLTSCKGVNKEEEDQLEDCTKLTSVHDLIGYEYTISGSTSVGEYNKLRIISGPTEKSFYVLVDNQKPNPKQLFNEDDQFSDASNSIQINNVNKNEFSIIFNLSTEYFEAMQLHMDWSWTISTALTTRIKIK